MPARCRRCKAGSSEGSPLENQELLTAKIAKNRREVREEKQLCKQQKILCFLRFPLEGAFQGLVQRGLGLVVFLLRDASLLVIEFQLEEFFL